jgi:hypothetical protein
MSTGDSHIDSHSQHRLSDQVLANTADAQASQKAGLCTKIAGDRQAALVWLGVPAIGVDLPSRTRAQNEQSGGELASSGATPRAQAATLQISPIRSMLSEHARCRPQHLQPPTPSRLAIDVADLQSRGGRAMVRRRRSSVRPDQPLCHFLSHACCRDKAPAPSRPNSASRYSRSPPMHPTPSADRPSRQSMLLQSLGRPRSGRIAGQTPIRLRSPGSGPYPRR